MPRGKVVKFPSPDDVAKNLMKKERAVQKVREDRMKTLITKIGPTLLEWKDDEKTKEIPNTHFEDEAEQDRVAAALTSAGWKVNSGGNSIIVNRPVIVTKRGGTAAAPVRRQVTRRASRDPAPVGAPAAE